MTGKLPAILLACAAALAAAGCGGDDGAEAPDVVAGVGPVGYLAECIAAEHLRVGVLVAAGQDPHTYWPSPRQMTDLGKARLLLIVGLPIEQRIAGKLASRQGGARIVDLTAGLDMLPSADEHDEGQLDPHVWMSPRLARAMAARICDELCKLAPAHEADLMRGNLDVLQARLDKVDAEMAAALAPLKGRTFYVFHPCFGYFARDYGLKQKAVETGGKAPGARHVKDLIDKAKKEGVKVIFVQPQFPQAAARAVAEKIGGSVVHLDPLARDYIENLRRAAAALKKALGP